MAMPLRYAELTPEQLEAVWSKKPLAIIPWGALEWHGPHLPLGLDGIVAEWFCDRLAEASGGVLLPGCWMPITTLPHLMSLQVRTDAFQEMLDDTLEGLYMAGARIVCIVSGHYAQGHEIELYQAALRAMDTHRGYRVLAATPLEPLGDPDLLDHAGKWEAAQLLAIRPELVNLAALPEGERDAREIAVLGEDPRRANAEMGREILEKALRTWTEWIDEIARSEDTAFLRDFYERRKRDYQPYVRTYFTDSWEQAILDWWLTRT
jgi:creatinine amidohydrolase